MTRIVLPPNKVITKQPQIPVLLDANNPLNRGLALLTSFGANALDAKSGKLGAIEAGASLVGSQYGVALRPAVTAGYKPADVTDASSFLSTTEYTLMLLVRVNSLGTRRIICADFNSAGITESINIEQNASNQWVTYHVNASTQWLGLSPNLAVTVGWHWIEIVFKQGTGFFGVVDDVLNASDISGAASVARRAGADYRVGRPGAYPGLGFDGDIAFHGAWNRAVSNPERALIRANPWQLFLPTRTPIFTTVAINTGVYAASDISTTGWTGSPYTGDLASNINEVTSSNSEYIQSPDTNMMPDPITFTLNNSLAAGTWELDFTARYVTHTGDIKLTLLDSGGSSVGDTGWITVASSFTGYTPTITSTGTATKIKVEVR